MAKRAVLPQDTALPQLEALRTRRPFVEKLQDAVTPFVPAGTTVEDVLVTECQHRRGETCKLILEVEFRQSNGYREWQTYIVRTAREGHPAPAQLYQKTRDDTLVPPRFGPPVLFINDWNMVLWAYPNDPNLPGLRLLESPKMLLKEMQEEPHRFGLPELQGMPVEVRTERLKVVPGKRGGFLVRVQFGPADTPQTCSLYAKLFRIGYGKEAFELLQTIWQHPARKQGEILIPQPYAFDAPYAVMWQEAVQGMPLAKRIDSVHDVESLAHAIGRRLARLHAIAVSLPEQMTLPYQLSEIDTAVRRIAARFPDFAARYQQLAGQLQKAASRFGEGRRTLVHGSFKFSHIMMTASGILFIDFDAANIGDPGYDVGRFMAHVLRMHVSGKMSFERAESINHAFIRGYNEQADAPLSEAYFNWFCASHLVASQALKLVKRNKPAQLEPLYQLARHYCPRG